MDQLDQQEQLDQQARRGRSAQLVPLGPRARSVRLARRGWPVNAGLKALLANAARPERRAPLGNAACPDRRAPLGNAACPDRRGPLANVVCKAKHRRAEPPCHLPELNGDS